MGKLADILTYPLPYRVALARYLRSLKHRISGAPYIYRCVFGEVPRPHYGYCLYHAAVQARALGHKRITAVEFGVAGGKGLRNVESHVKNIAAEVGVEFDVFGFDIATGLPVVDDYRDQPHKWEHGRFSIADTGRLRETFEFANLVIGDVKETAASFYRDHFKGAPLGCVFFDLDLYSSTMNAFRIFDTDPANLLPRIPCYFDDILGTNEFVGELGAIHAFNAANEVRKIAKPYGLHARRGELWNEKVFLFHDFKHPRYNEYLWIDDNDLF